MGGDAAYRKLVATDRLKREHALAGGHNHLVIKYTSFDTLEEDIIKELTNVCKYWFVKDGEVVATNELSDIGKMYSIPGDILVRDTLTYLNIKLIF